MVNCVCQMIEHFIRGRESAIKSFILANAITLSNSVETHCIASNLIIGATNTLSTCDEALCHKIYRQIACSGRAVRRDSESDFLSDI